MQRECPACAVAVARASRVCPVCGYQFPRRSRLLQGAALLLIAALVAPLLLRLANMLRR